MTLGSVGKASYGEFTGKRKLLVIPYVVAARDDPELVRLIEAYWSDAVAQVRNLERGLGPVSKVFHEGIAESGDGGLKALESGNPHGHEQLKRIIEAGGALEACEDVDGLLEAMDLHRCMSVVQASERVAKRLMEWFEESRQARYRSIASRIDRMLAENSVGVLVVSPDHDLKLAPGIEMIYVVPPSLDKVNEWLKNHATEPPVTRLPADDENPTWARRDPSA